MNILQFLSATSYRCKENKSSVCAIAWTFFGTSVAMRSEYESMKLVKMVNIDSSIKDDVDDDEVKR